MTINTIIIAITSLGLLSLAASLKPACEIRRVNQSKRWTLLCALIFSFVLGYICVLYFLITEEVDDYFGVVLSLILAGGGLFVFIISGISLNAIKEITDSLEQQRFLAEHDSITSHFNRDKFNYDLNYKVDHQQQFDLILFGISKFKNLIYAHDYEFVESLLYQFSHRILKSLSSNAALYRLVGDEFALLVDNTTGDEVNQTLQSIKTSLQKEFKVTNFTIQIDVFIGISRYPTMATQAKAIFKQADLALHEAQNTNKLYTFYFDELGERAEATRQMHDKIKSALNNNEFELYLQPIIGAINNELDGAEALIRWPQKNGDFINPDFFIAIAEQSGLINDITKWVILETINIISKLEEQNITGTIHINLSTKDLESKFFYEFLEKQFTKKPSISSSIIFEITEHAMMTNFSEAKETMDKLSNVGFKFSIDDFGTGFSSMTLLKKLPISQIKIDRSFVSDMLTDSTDFSIVESTLFLADKLGCNVVAEGVENKELQQSLTEMGCHFLQGYYFSKPIPVNDYINQHSTPKSTAYA